MFLSVEKNKLIEWRTTTSSSPWQFLLQLEQVLNADGPADSLIAEILRSFCLIDGVQSCYIASSGAADQLIVSHCGRQAGEVIRTGKRMAGDEFTKSEFINTEAHPVWKELAAEAWQAGKTTIFAPPHPLALAQSGWQSGWQSASQSDLQSDLQSASQSASQSDCKSGAIIMLRGRASLQGVVIARSCIEGFFEHNWPRESLSHIGALIGETLERHKLSASVNRADLLYKTLLSAADILLQARSEKAVLRKICALLADSGLFLSSRIGEFRNDGSFNNNIVYSASPSPKRQNLVKKFIPAADHELLSTRAWRTGKIQISNDYLNDPRFAPWHSVAESIGSRSIAILPIFRNGKCWALLSVDSSQVGFFDHELRELLERLARLVGHMLNELDLKRILSSNRATQNRVTRLDALTGLPNRLALLERLSGSVAAVQHGPHGIGIGLFALDDFAQFNARWGRAAGDFMLRALAERLSGTLRQGDFVARFDEDQFALILNNWSASNINGFSIRLDEALHAPVTLPGGHSVRISFCIGFTLCPADSADPERLLRHADVALHVAKLAKSNGGKFWEVYQNLDNTAQARLQYRSLLGQGALVTHFQPVIDILSGKVVSVEALARLQDGARLVLPGSFLPEFTLEDRNDLFRRVLRQGLQHMHDWDEAGHKLDLSVNVDAQILLLDGTLDYLIETLAQTCIAPSRLTLEILETHEFLDLEQATSRIAAIRSRGIKVALDDLGAGYSSIMKLHDLPLDVVKLDRAFIASLRKRPDGLAFIMAIQGLVTSLGMVLVVEGVETDDILDALRMIGPGRAQGYGIARPMPGDRLASWLDDYKPVIAGHEPVTLLGAYAVHLIWLSLFRVERAGGPILKYLQRYNSHNLDSFFELSGIADTGMAKAYEALQTILLASKSERSEISAAADHFRAAMIEGLERDRLRLAQLSQPKT